MRLKCLPLNRPGRRPPAPLGPPPCPPARPRVARRGGFTLVEILIGVMLLGLLAVGVVRVLLGGSARAGEALDRQTALGLARSTIERIRAAGPLTYRTAGDAFRVTSDGTRTEAGPYGVTITRRVDCHGGPVTEDTPASLLSWACGAEKPMVSYTVSVSYAARSRGPGGHVEAVTMSTQFGDAELTGSSCSGGRSWDPATGTCACPGGQAWTGSACLCPTGMAWSGLSCVASVCTGPFTEYETRSDCAGGQAGSSTWRRDVSPTWCASGPTPAWGAWAEVSRSCGCPGGMTFVGGVCACASAGGALTQPAACPPTQVSTSPRTRTFDAGTCTYSAWTGGTCGCPAALPNVAQDGTCHPACTGATIWNPVTATCDLTGGVPLPCPASAPNLGADGTCHPACPATTVWDAGLNQCRCPAGMVFVSGACVPAGASPCTLTGAPSTMTSVDPRCLVCPSTPGLWREDASCPAVFGVKLSLPGYVGYMRPVTVTATITGGLGPYVITWTHVGPLSGPEPSTTGTTTFTYPADGGPSGFSRTPYQIGTVHVRVVDAGWNVVEDDTWIKEGTCGPQRSGPAVAC